MEFYPRSFNAEAASRSLALQVQAKKGAVADVIIKINNVGMAEFRDYGFRIERSTSGCILRWEHEIDQEVELSLYASSGLGQVVQSIKLHPPEKPELPKEPPRPEPGKSLGEGMFTIERLMSEHGLTRAEALGIFREKMGLPQRPVDLLDEP